MTAVMGDPGSERVLVYGNSGTCSYAAWEGMQQSGGRSEIAAYINDDPTTPRIAPDGKPVIVFEEIDTYPGLPVLIPIHLPADRRMLWERVIAAGRRIIGLPGDPQWVHPFTTFGEGVIISSTTRILPGVNLARGVIAFSHMLAEEVRVGEFTTLGMRSMVLGHVEIGANVLVAPGAVINNGRPGHRRTIGDGAVIGTGAVVSRNVKPGEVLMGNPAMSPAEWDRLKRMMRRGE
ncbi:MAG: hypothetical protein Q4G35_07380 [Propionibacteriaceae bacterium]|nr:hypothetical protein [Propionibacteriaceae bacterium]